MNVLWKSSTKAKDLFEEETSDPKFKVTLRGESEDLGLACCSDPCMS